VTAQLTELFQLLRADIQRPHIVPRKHHVQSLDHRAQLAHVAGPGVFHQQPHRIAVEAQFLAALAERGT
jgi:hypothetical protein